MNSTRAGVAVKHSNLSGCVALVAGATRGAGRAIAIELAANGATVYVTGRSTRAGRSEMDRPEVIEETAELITARGGRAIAIQVDHTDSDQVKELMDRIDQDERGRLDIAVNAIWGGDHLCQWRVPVWQHNLQNALRLQEVAVNSHLITSWYVANLMVRRGAGLMIEITDGITSDYRGSLYYDLAKSSINRLTVGLAQELREQGVCVIAVSPGYLRSEAMLDRFGVTEASWRDAIAKDPHVEVSESPAYVARIVAALAKEDQVMLRTGRALATWNLAKEFGVYDADGSQPDWGTYSRNVLGMDSG